MKKKPTLGENLKILYARKRIERLKQNKHDREECETYRHWCDWLENKNTSIEEATQSLYDELLKKIVYQVCQGISIREDIYVIHYSRRMMKILKLVLKRLKKEGVTVGKIKIDYFNVNETKRVREGIRVDISWLTNKEWEELRKKDSIEEVS